MKFNKIIKFFVLISIFFIGLSNVRAFDYGYDAYTGGNIPLSMKTNIDTSWWPSSGPQGIRITLVDGNTGDRIAGSISVDYSVDSGISTYKQANLVNGVKRSKIDYINTETIPLSNFTTTATANKPIGNLTKFISINTVVADDAVENYIKNTFLDFNKPAHKLVDLLRDLRAPAGMITDIESSITCHLTGTCQSSFTILSNKYKYALLVEPLAYFVINNNANRIAATATEAILLLGTKEQAGFVRGLTHNNMPKSIYIKEDHFTISAANYLTKANVAVMEGKSYPTVSSMIGHNGVGIGVFWIFDELPPIPDTCQANPTCINGDCGETSSFKDDTNWDCITNDADFIDLTKGNLTYCPVYCRQEVESSFPLEVSSLTPGTNFVFEPVSITAYKECRADVKLTQWKADYDAAVSQMQTAYNNYREANIKYLTWKYIDDRDRTAVGTFTAQTTPSTAYGNITSSTYCSRTPSTREEVRRFPATASGCFNNTTGPIFGDVDIEYILTVANPLRANIDFPRAKSFDNRICQLKEKSGASFSLYGICRPYGTDTSNCMLGYVRNPFPTPLSYNDYRLTYLRTDFDTPVNFERFMAPNLQCDFGNGIVVDGYDGIVTTGGGVYIGSNGTCIEEELTPAVETGDRVYWGYKYPSTSATYKSGSATGTCLNSGYTTTLANARSAALTTYTNARNRVTSLRNAMASCTGWSMELSQKPTVVAEQKEVLSSGTVTKTYNLISSLINKSVSPQAVYCDPANATCATTLYDYNCVGDVCNSSDRVVSTLPKVTRVGNSITETFGYTLPPDTNRFILKDGTVTSLLPIDYQIGGQYEGAYSEVSYPNYSFSYDVKKSYVDGNVVYDYSSGGSITIKYKNIGEGSKFDTCMNRDAAGFANYTCDYSFADNDSDPDDDDEEEKCIESLFNCCGPCPGGINLIYRPIDLEDPFNAVNGAGREPGFNWRYEPIIDLVDKYITNNRGVTADAVYNLEPMYVIDFTGKNKFMLNQIRQYNKTHKYDDFEMACTGKDLLGNSNLTECRSTFLREEIVSIVSGCGMDGNWNKCSGVNR
jgi:hypothetical protein